MQFDVTILGCSSATPTFYRHPTSQLLNISGRTFLIDCGEGTQIQLLKYRLKAQSISHIFISHLHGDHYFGLVGLISTLHLNGRTKPLTIFCHPGLKEIIDIQLKFSETELNYPIIYHFLEYEKEMEIFSDEAVIVKSFPMNHRIQCCGFTFEEKQRERNINKEAAKAHGVPYVEFPKLKKGEDFIDMAGDVIKNAYLTEDPLAPRKYAYCSDTAYFEPLINSIHGADLLYHEATFLQELQARADKTLHSTAADAGTIAEKAKVRKLIIGHFSSRYRDLQPLLDEAKSRFENTELAEEGKTYLV